MPFHTTARAIAKRTAAGALLLVLAADCGGAWAASCVPNGERVAITDIGEDLSFHLADGRSLRLAGLAWPPAGSDSARPAERVRAALRQAWVGRTARADLGAQDRWGRWPALIFPDPADQGALTVRTASAWALAVGLARLRPEPEAHRCFAELLEAEETARGLGLGLWADPSSSILASDDRAALAAASGAFAIVEGRAAVERRRGRMLLRLFPGPLAGVVGSGVERALQRAGLDLASLAGRKLRLRGFLDNRDGYRIDITTVDQIEPTAERPDTPGAEAAESSAPIRAP